MADCTTLASKPTKLYRSLDNVFDEAELIAGIKSMTNVHHTYATATSTAETCMDGNTIPASASTTDITYGSSALTLVMLPAQHAIILGDSDLQTELFWQVLYSDGSIDVFKGRVTGINENFSGDYIEESLTVNKTSKSVFTPA